MARLGEVERRPETAPVVEVVEDEDAPTRGSAVPSSTSWIATTSARVDPGEPIDHRECALEPGRVPAGDPVATIDLVRPDGGDHVRGRRPRRAGRRPRARSSRRPYQAIRSVIWPRDGCSPARRN